MNKTDAWQKIARDDYEGRFSWNTVRYHINDPVYVVRDRTRYGAPQATRRHKRIAESLECILPELIELHALPQVQETLDRLARHPQYGAVLYELASDLGLKSTWTP